MINKESTINNAEMNSYCRRRLLLCTLKFYGVRRLYFFTLTVFITSVIIFVLVGYHHRDPGWKKTTTKGRKGAMKDNGGSDSVNANYPDQKKAALPKPVPLTSTAKTADTLPQFSERIHDKALSRVYTLMQNTQPNYNIHTFYYPWYGNPKFDKVYLHWGHTYVQHWNPLYAKQWPSGRHVPPDDIGSSFYPYLGPYSSRDKKVIENHMLQIRAAGIGVVVVSWLPRNSNDGEGDSWNRLMPLLLDTAHKYSLKVAIHLEPYKHRSIFSIKNDLRSIFKHYGSHPAFHKHTHGGKTLPIMYAYDSYEIALDRWQYLLKPGGRYSIRGTELDVFFIGLLVKASHRREIFESGFDGFYTYFASVGFSYGASPHNWGTLSAFARQKNMIFIPSVGPGYDDTRIRPWNYQNKKLRNNGTYFRNNFNLALKAKASVITITSFNEWHEGSQIEMAKPRDIKNSYDDVIYSYEDYAPNAPDYYIAVTNQLVRRFSELQEPGETNHKG